MRLEVENILLARDASPSSDTALRHALGLARLFDANLQVFHALPAENVETAGTELGRRRLGEAWSSAIEHAEQLKLSGRLRGIRHELLIGGEMLPTLIQNRDFDLAVVETTSTGKGLAVGKAASMIIQASRRPVLCVGTGSSHTGTSRFSTIVYATDFSPGSMEAARHAVFLAQEFQARLIVLHVVDEIEDVPPAASYKPWLDLLVSDEARLWCDPEPVVDYGHAPDRILQVANENQADLIVLGANGFTFLCSPGKTAQAVLKDAACPVLIVPVSHEEDQEISPNLAADDQQRMLTAVA
jgi:nucleotide-binding universal stress UspA family protein